jgi:hypothetical protein
VNDCTWAKFVDVLRSRVRVQEGRKRHLLVDTLGLLVAVLITAAALDDGVAAPRLLSQITPEDFPRLSVLFGDSATARTTNDARNRVLR